MSPERLLSHFEQISEAPGAVPRLRQFILDLAVRGKLVEQDPKDEPAVELLKRIHDSKLKYRRNGETKEPILTNTREMPFEIPANWEWVPATWPAISISDTGKKIQTKDVLDSGEFPVVDQGKAFIRGYCNDVEKVIRIDEPIIVFGDHTRETKLINFDFIVGADGVKLLKPVIINPTYYFLTLQWLPLDSRGYGRHFKLLRTSLIALPPLAEQRRIVAKVDELMALCDQLEAAQAKRERRRNRLVAATLHGLNNGDAGVESDVLLHFEKSARFYFKHLPRITTSSEHVQQLRQTILALAIQGKLVAQNVGDEPASSLVTKIREAKNKSVSPYREKSDLLSKALNSFEIPSCWTWTTFREVAQDFRYGTSKKCDYATEGQPILRIPNVSKGRITTNDLKFTTLTEGEKETLSLSVGDLLMVRSNGSLGLVGRPALVEEHVKGYYYAGYLVRVRFIANTVDSRYLIAALNSKFVRDQIELPIRSAVGLKNVNCTELGNLRIPLPPLAEQHRIVSRVNELMALCDELEAQLTETSTNRRQLLDATLNEALCRNLC